MSSKICAIVDAYSSSNLYAPALKTLGYECIAIQGQARPTDLIAGSFRAEDFTEVLPFSGDVAKLVSQLKKRNVQWIIPGMEMGLELADTLGEQMESCFHNDPRTSHQRRNKFDMVEAVRAHGLRAAVQTKAQNLQDVLLWAREKNLWPLVVKPADSGGADRVLLCHNEQEIVQAVQGSLGSLGRQGRVVQEVVIQEFLRGTEYIVDTVSYQGHHRIANIWKYHRVAVNGAQFVYDTKELVSFEGQESLIDYAKAALDAVGLKNGPAHSEIMLTQQGPMLVEINARMGGSAAPLLNRECLGLGQLELMMDVMFHPERFLSSCDLPYKIKKHGLAVYFISSQEGKVVNPMAVERIKSLPSYFRLSLSNPPGTKLEKTVDMFTMPGMVELVHEDPEQVQKDYAEIRKLEESGEFYI